MKALRRFWCLLVGHRWGTTSKWEDFGTKGKQERHVSCSSCGVVVYRQVRGENKRVIVDQVVKP
jgi:hypothetical protein